MMILGWALFGLLSGFVAHSLMSDGRLARGLHHTLLLGLIGALVGGFLGSQVGVGDVTRFDARGLLLAIGGAMLVLFFHRQVQAR